MAKVTLQSKHAVAETLLMPLYTRAVEARHSAPLLRDDLAVILVEQIDYDFSRFKMMAHDVVGAILRVREFDHRARGFLARHPQAVVVQIGCGLDTRFLAEGVLPYFEEEQVKGLFRTLAARFPGAEMVCDAFTPLMIRLHNFELVFSKVSARLAWGLRDPREPEGWVRGH